MHKRLIGKLGIWWSEEKLIEEVQLTEPGPDIGNKDSFHLDMENSDRTIGRAYHMIKCSRIDILWLTMGFRISKKSNN